MKKAVQIFEEETYLPGFLTYLNETPEDLCFNQTEAYLNTIAVQPTIKNNCKEIFCDSGSIIKIGCVLHKLQLVRKHFIKKVPKIQEVISILLQEAKILRNNKKWNLGVVIDDYGIT